MIEGLLHALTSARFLCLDEAELQPAVARPLDDSKITDLAKGPARAPHAQGAAQDGNGGRGLMERTIKHHLKLPQRVDDLHAACGPVQRMYLWTPHDAANVLVADIHQVTCCFCLAEFGIAPAGPRLVDADGAEVAA